MVAAFADQVKNFEEDTHAFRRTVTRLVLRRGTVEGERSYETEFVICLRLLFPTCQVRVVRFYKSCLARRLILLRVVLLSCMLQWAAPDLNCKLQIAVGSAGPQPGAQDYSGQRRTSTGELASGVCSAGPHPGSFRAEWATPDLTSQKKDVRRYVKKECQKICQHECPKRMS